MEEAVLNALNATSKKSKQVHSICFISRKYGNISREFGDKAVHVVSTYDEWHLIPETRPVINFPSPKYKFLDIPGANSSLDMTNAVSGFVPFGQRTGSIKFMVENGYKHWEHLSSDIANFLSGTDMAAVLEDDPDYYYTGRWHVSGWDSPNNGTWSTITLDYTLDPYKLWITSTAERYPWRSYQLEATTNLLRSPRVVGVEDYAGSHGVNNIKNVHVDHAITFHLVTDMMPTTPTFIISIDRDHNSNGYVLLDMIDFETGIHYNDYKLYDGTTRIDELILYRGGVDITITGACTCTIDYRGGRL